MVVDDAVCYPDVVPAWAAPLTHPGEFCGLMNSKNEEIVMLKSLDELDADSRACLEKELRRRYLTSTVHRVLSAKVEFGATYWTVVTERGERDFVMQSLQENAVWLGPEHLVLVDIDANRFEIPDIRKLDAESIALVRKVV
jgi:hypothetical protein